MERTKHNRGGFVWSFGAKNLLLLVAPAFRTFAGRVSEAGKTAGDGESEYQVYYMNQAVTKLIAQPYRTRTTDTEALIGELMEKPDFMFRQISRHRVSYRTKWCIRAAGRMTRCCICFLTTIIPA